MPIEIRELVIKAEIASSGATRENSANSAQPSAGTSNSNEELIQEIVDKVIEVLERKQER
jgi:hypothetical protein